MAPEYAQALASADPYHLRDAAAVALLEGQPVAAVRRAPRGTEAHGTIHVDLVNHAAIGDDGVLTGSVGLHGNARGHAIAAAAVLRRLSFEF